MLWRKQIFVYIDEDFAINFAKDFKSISTLVSMSSYVFTLVTQINF